MAGVRPCHACALINMRPKIVLAIIVTGFVAFTGLLVLHSRSGNGADGARPAQALAGSGDGQPLGGVLTGSASNQKPAAPPRLPAAAGRRLYAVRGAGTADAADSASAAGALTPEQ